PLISARSKRPEQSPAGGDTGTRRQLRFELLCPTSGHDARAAAVARLAVYRNIYAHLERFWGLSGRCATGWSNAEPGGAGGPWYGAELCPRHGGESRQCCRVGAHEAFRGRGGGG